MGKKPLSKDGLKLLISNFLVEFSSLASDSAEFELSERLIDVDDVPLAFELANDALIRLLLVFFDSVDFESIVMLGGVTIDHPLCVLCVFSKLILGMNGASNCWFT